MKGARCCTAELLGYFGGKQRNARISFLNALDEGDSNCILQGLC